jgi:hypothetical protein
MHSERRGKIGDEVGVAACGGSEMVRSAASEGTTQGSAAPVKPARLKIRFVESGDRLAFTYRQREWGKGGFLLVWLIGWTVGCVFLAGLAIREPCIQTFLFAVPFWASWVFVFFVLLNALFRLEYFALDATGVDFARRVIVPLGSRRVPLEELQRFRTCSKVVDRESGHTEEGIEIETLGRSLSFAWGLSDEERRWLVHQLNVCLAALRGSAVEEDNSQDEPASLEQVESDVESSAVEGPEAEVRDARSEPSPPPSDCRWRRGDEFDTIMFTQRGRFSFSGFFSLLFINAFWNGIVSMFVYQLWFGQAMPPGIGWWGLFFFLIPFELIGLAMFVALVGTALEPVRRTTWRFGGGLIECRVQWLGLGPHWRYWVDAPLRIELVKSDRRRKPKQQNIASFGGAEGVDKSLVFVGSDNTEVCTMPRLTEGEARWIASTLRQERPNGFE